MAWCVAVGCKSRSGVIGENNELIYFHYFPKDPEVRAKWIHNVQRGNAWAPSRYSRLCSLHFEKSCFQGGVMDNALLPHAVPTLFPNLPLAYKTSKRQSQSKDEHSTPKRSKTREIILPSSCRTEFQKYEKLLIMMPYYLRCRCCLRKRMLQDMWSEQVHDGQREVFGEMLVECFALDLRQPAEHIEQICVVCVSRLRQAVQFKERVLASDRLINKCFYNVRLNFDSDSDTETTKDKEQDSYKKNTENLERQEFHKDSTDNLEHGDVNDVLEQENLNQDSTDNLEQDHSIQESTENVYPDFYIQENTEKDQEDVYQDSTDNYLDEDFNNQDSTDNLEKDYFVQETTENEDHDYSTQGNTKSEMQDCNEVDFIQESTGNEKRNREGTASDKNKGEVLQGDDGAEYLELDFLEDDNNSVVSKKAHPKPIQRAARKNVQKKVYFVTRSYVKKEVETVNESVDTVKRFVKTVRSPVVPVNKRVEPVKKYVEPVKKPVEPVKKPVEPVKKPVEPVKKPVATVKKPVATVKKLVETENKSVEIVKKKLDKQIVPEGKRTVNLRKCLEAMKNEELSRGEASDQDNVPKGTINVMLNPETRKKSKLTPEEMETKVRNENARLKLLQEIKHILKYTDATPYKTWDSRFHCAYCTKGPFAEPGALRSHTKLEHAKERLLAVNTFMRPPKRYEILKLDIENLGCVECGSPISSWNDMFNHLRVHHGLELDEAYTKIIPYKLDELACVMCNEKFSTYPVLDNHMNVHYNNYTCNDCSETFITKKRLKAHEDVHTKGKFLCEYCPKVFSQDRHRKKHENLIHNKKANFKCRYCPEAYPTQFTRHLHMIKHHRAKSETFCCTFCGKSFNWRPYFVKHMQLEHLKREKSYQCALCKKKYRSPQHLKNHENWHKGTRDCECGVCGRKFVTRKFLKKHYEMAHSVQAVDE